MNPFDRHRIWTGIGVVAATFVGLIIIGSVAGGGSNTPKVTITTLDATPPCATMTSVPVHLCATATQPVATVDVSVPPTAVPVIIQPTLVLPAPIDIPSVPAPINVPNPALVAPIPTDVPAAPTAGYVWDGSRCHFHGKFVKSVLCGH